ncbi:MAG: tRNA uracil 4-sulfurtransferase ThiI [bacterium]
MPLSFDSGWQTVLVHYHEIGLKGGNRPRFELKLCANLERVLGDLPLRAVIRLPGRILVSFTSPVEAARVRERLEWVPGVESFAPAMRFPLELERVAESAAEVVAARRPASFGVKARRGYKSVPESSQEIGALVGAAIVARTGIAVDLKKPAQWVRVEVLPRDLLLSFDRFRGAGGLPVGTAGTVVALVSGGIDSPVAAWRLMKRGARCVFLHFHSHPFTDAASQEKTLEVVERLARIQGKSVFYLCPFADLQKELVARAPAPLRVILYRRFMVRVANVVARRERALALVTGESVGQVASQTLENLATVDAVAELPMLRPLVGMNKNEIVEEAERLGTFEISIQPHGDCCSFLLRANPRPPPAAPSSRRWRARGRWTSG